MIIVARSHNESCDLKTTVAVIMMLTISDMYDFAEQQIVALQPPTSTAASGVVAEAIFVGVLASQMLTFTVGMSLFVAWQRGGAGTICATAAATGSAVLGPIKLGLPVLGPGPTIRALIGVVGAAGVFLAAAGAATDQYQPEGDWRRLSGRLGVTVGAAVGAFLMSCAHSGLSAMFMALCAATAPAAAFLKLLHLHFTSWRLKGLCDFIRCVVFYSSIFIIYREYVGRFKCWYRVCVIFCSMDSVPMKRIDMKILYVPQLHKNKTINTQRNQTYIHTCIYNTGTWELFSYLLALFTLPPCKTRNIDDGGKPMNDPSSHFGVRMRST